MSRIASRVSSVSASGSTFRNVWPARFERRDIVGGEQAIRRVVVVAGGEQLLVLECAHGRQYTARRARQVQRSQRPVYQATSTSAALVAACATTASTSAPRRR